MFKICPCLYQKFCNLSGYAVPSAPQFATGFKSTCCQHGAVSSFESLHSIVFILMLVSTVAVLVVGLITCQFIHYQNNLTCNCCLSSVLIKRHPIESCIHLTPYELGTWKKGQHWNLKLKFVHLNKKIEIGIEDLDHALKFYCNTCKYHGYCICWE